MSGENEVREVFSRLERDFERKRVKYHGAKMIRLELKELKITELPPDIFNELTYLKKLDLKINQLSEYPP